MESEYEPEVFIRALNRKRKMDAQVSAYMMDSERGARISDGSPISMIRRYPVSPSYRPDTPADIRDAGV
jgi:hypothetical protein